MTSYDYIMVMRRIGIADLKARLSEHLRYVRRGHRVTVLDRETPVAELRPVAGTAELPTRQPAGRHHLGRIRLLPPLEIPADAVALIRAERGDR